MSLVVFYLPNTLLEALHDSGAGDVDGSGGFFEVGGDLWDGFGFYGGLPEGEPGFFGKLPADLSGGAAEELAAVFGFDFCIVWFGVLLEPSEFGGAALARVGSLAAEGVDDCVAGDSGEPGTETCFLGIGFPAMDRFGHGKEDGLGEVLGVGVLHPSPAGHAVNHGAIDGYELVPRLGIGRISELEQQAVTCFGEFVHDIFFSHQEHTHGAWGSFRSLSDIREKYRRPGEDIGGFSAETVLLQASHEHAHVRNTPQEVRVGVPSERISGIAREKGGRLGSRAPTDKQRSGISWGTSRRNVMATMER